MEKTILLEKRQQMFIGEKIRTYIGSEFNFSGKVLYNVSHSHTCQFWAVVTTIFRPSSAVRKLVQDPVWCTVIVADKKTPLKHDYLTELGIPISNNTIFLTTNQQASMFPHVSTKIPWNHFARKNIGYMYAIKQNATHIWDFDDDNMNVLPIEL